MFEDEIRQREEITMQINALKEMKTMAEDVYKRQVISGDHDGLERVIINIVSNAMKYTREGGTIEVYSSKVYNDICIKVADNGIGIQEDKLPHIFDRFYRVDKARSVSYTHLLCHCNTCNNRHNLNSCLFK